MFNFCLWIVGFTVVAFCLMSFSSNYFVSADVGLKNGKLKPCKKAPNCVCSEFVISKTHYVESITIQSGLTNAMQKAIATVLEMNGEVLIQSEHYLYATFKTPIFRFKDDFELRYSDQTFFVRSSSRIGYSDLGANLKRVNAFKAAFSEGDRLEE